MLSDAAKGRFFMYGLVVLLVAPVLGMFLTGHFEPPPKFVSVPYVAVVIVMMFGFGHSLERTHGRGATRW